MSQLEQPSGCVPASVCRGPLNLWSSEAPIPNDQPHHTDDLTCPLAHIHLLLIFPLEVLSFVVVFVRVLRSRTSKDQHWWLVAGLLAFAHIQPKHWTHIYIQYQL